MCYCRRHSPWLFHMNSGSCNGCDIELIASLTPRYDAEQLGVRLEGSPRHADILCITGPVTHNAVNAIKTVYGQVCGPKAVVAIGSCPATTNVFIDSRTLDGPLNKHIPVDVFVPGCPPRPDAIIQGVAKAAEILAERGRSRPIVAALGEHRASVLERRRCSHESDHRPSAPAHLSRTSLRRSRRVVLPLGGTQGRRPDAGAHRPSLHAAVLRLHQAAGQRPRRRAAASAAC